jgi:MFS family permease
LISVISGICFGATLSLLPTHVSKEWGTKHFATNWALLFPAITVGSFLLGSLLPGLVYDAQVKEGEKDCVGVWCFRYSFIISSGINLVCTLLALLLVWRHRKKEQAKLVEDDVVSQEKEKVKSESVVGSSE